jgi:ribosomal protein L3
MARLPRIEEPRIDGVATSIQLVNAMNWYHQNMENKDAIKYIQDYAKKNKIAGRVDTSQSILTLGWLCRLVTNGNQVGEQGEKFIKTHMKKVMEVQIDEPVTVVDTTPTVSIQDRLKEKVGEIAVDLEAALDDYVTSDFKTMSAPMSIMHDRAKGMHAQKLVEHFKKRRIEFDEVLNTDDKDLREGYSNFTKPQLKKLIAFCDAVITDALKIAGEAKVNRKKPKRKQKTPDQLVSKMNFCKEDETFKLKSIAPRDVVGALQLWVFNVKTRKLGVYHAEDAAGLSVKGSSLLNYSESKSLHKTLRKPNEIIPNVLSGGKIVLKGILGKINSKESELSGRINTETILLRAIK